MKYIWIYVQGSSIGENQSIEEDVDAFNDVEINEITNNTIDQLLRNIEKVSRYLGIKKF